MNRELSSVGAANEEFARMVHDEWAEAATKAGVDLTGFNTTATLAERIAWAGGIGLDVATVYARCNRRHPQPVADQVRECVAFAANNRMYVPPELVSTDEGGSGRRDGLARLRAILDGRHATVLLVSSISRLFRQSHRGYEFIENNAVRMGLRAIGVDKPIDTANTRMWQMLLMVHVAWRDVLRRHRYRQNL